MEVKEKEPEDKSLEEYQGKWAILWFHNDGRSKPGIFQYESEVIASNFIRNNCRDSKNWHVEWPDGTYWDQKEVSHAIPIPVGDK